MIVDSDAVKSRPADILRSITKRLGYTQEQWPTLQSVKHVACGGTCWWCECVTCSFWSFLRARFATQAHNHLQFYFRSSPQDANKRKRDHTGDGAAAFAALARVYEPSNAALAKRMHSNFNWTTVTASSSD
jgi:hypothetical protein